MKYIKPVITFFTCVTLITLSGCSSPQLANIGHAIAPIVGAAAGYEIGSSVEDSDFAKVAGATVGLIAVQELQRRSKEHDENLIQAAELRAGNEARAELLSNMWNNATGADGSHYTTTGDYTAIKPTRLLDNTDFLYDGGVNYGM